MGSQGPGDIPRVVRRRKARANRQPKRPPQPTPTEALKGRAYGSRPARPLPKPASAPKPRAVPAPRQTASAAEAQRQVRRGKVAAPKRTMPPKSAPRAPASAIPGLGSVPRARAIAAVAKSGGDFSISAPESGRADKAAAATAKRIGREIKRHEDGHFYAKVPRAGLPDRHVPVDPFTGKVDRAHQKTQASAKVQSQSVDAPALKTLDQLTRPIHAISAGETAAIKREGVVKGLFGVRSPSSATAKAQRKAAKRGFALKDRSMGSDVLKAAGVKNKGVAAAGGFVLDVLQDPLTYTTAGTGSVAEKAGVKAARRVKRKAVAAGASQPAAERLSAAAGRRAAQKAKSGSGVTVKFAGQEVPGLRRATAAVSRETGRAARKVAPRATETASTKGRNIARTFAPRVRPAGVSEEQFFAGRSAARQARAHVTTQAQKAMTHANKLQRELPKEDYAKVIDAIERNDLSRLPSKELAQHARVLRDQLRGVRRLSRRAGVAAGHKVGDTSKFLGKTDLKRLDKSIAAEQRAQKRAISRAVSKEQHTRERALVTEAVGSQTGKRAQQAATRYERKAATTHLNLQKLKAAQGVPKQAKGEADHAYLQRVVAHAKTHDLPLVRQRAEKLLAKAPTDVARGYFPREFDERILKQLGVTKQEAQAGAVRRVGGAGPGARVSPTTAGFRRGEQRRLATVNAERVAKGEVPHSENIPLVVANHMREAARATSQGEFAKSLAKAGRRVKQGDELKPGEAVYKLGYKGRQFGLHEHTGPIPKTGRSGGQYIALNKHLKDAMEGSAVPAQARGDVAHIYDAATGGFKKIATWTIGFHVRNMIGDIQQAYTGEIAGHRLPGTVRQAARATARASEQARTVIPSKTEATIKVAGKHQPIDEFLAGAKRNGVLDAGYIGRELHDLGARASGQVRVKGERGPLKGVRAAGRNRTAQVSRWMTNRENVMRIATYKHALDRGLSEQRAAEMANMIHVDYGELSDFERKVMRRAFPFYTWTARQLPVQAKMVVKHPGKFAAIEKAREETAAGFGMNEQDTRRGMTEATQRQIPFVIKLPGKDPIAVSASLPATLLNELPTGASPQALNAYLNEVGRFTTQMLTPFAKAPTELYLNRQFYTKQDIESDRRVLVPAPSWVKWLPDKAKRELEVTPNYVNKRTGTKTWGWRGRADWFSHQIPGAPQQVSQVVSGGRPGQPKDTTAAALGAAGIRTDTLSAAATKRTAEIRTYKKLADLNRKATILNQQGINSDNPTPEYKALRKQINDLEHTIKPPKGRKRRSSGPLPLGGGAGGQKLPLGGGSTGAKLPLG